VESLLPRRSTAGRVGRAAIRSTGRGQRRHGSSPPRTGRCMSSWFAHRMWIDRRNLNRRIILAAQAHHDPRGQDGHEQQERPAAPSQGHTPRPRACRPSRGRYCAGVEKQSPGVESSAVHVSVRMWRITLPLREAPNGSKCSRGLDISRPAASRPAWATSGHDLPGSTRSAKTRFARFSPKKSPPPRRAAGSINEGTYARRL